MGDVVKGRFGLGEGSVLDGSLYTITIDYVMTDEDTGEWQYHGTCKEFPDVEIWDYHASQAYWNVVSVIEDLIALADEMGKDYPPCPWAIQE